MLLIAIVGVLGSIVFASMAYTHFRDHTGEHRPWVVASGAFLLIGALAILSQVLTNPKLFTPQVLPATAKKPKVTAETIAIPPPEPAAPAPAMKAPPLSAWHPVASYSGSNDGSTGLFNIKGKSWRVFWDLERKAEQGKFSFFIYKKGASKPLPPTALISGDDKETRVFESGQFYIKVSAQNVDWSFKVEDSYVEK